jgi:hypothetical protein
MTTAKKGRAKIPTFSGEMSERLPVGDNRGVDPLPEKLQIFEIGIGDSGGACDPSTRTALPSSWSAGATCVGVTGRSSVISVSTKTGASSDSK